ncbi:hypothetical protein [Actinomycetospora flava]|uniref:Uncharacterized protein n=1 Tax=Actinomycetospora flava TaxID=3129232 RepID=A0ABU8M4S8_9PSEU
MVPVLVPGDLDGRAPLRCVSRRVVPADAPPAGLGYPPPTAYRRDPVTGVPTPPRAMPSTPPVAPAPRRRRAATRAPLAVAVAGAAMALVGMGAQIPGLVTAVSASAATAPAPAAPTVVGQCATVVADAIDETVVTLGRTPSGQWAGVVAAREGDLAATYGDSSPEQRAYAAGVDDVMDWLQTDPVAAEDWNLVTTRVARTVATTCAH